MVGEIAGSSPGSSAGNNLAALLAPMEREEILGVFSGADGFCEHCEGLLLDRIRSLRDKKDVNLLSPSDKTDSSGAMGLNYASNSSSARESEGSMTISSRSGQQESGPWSSMRSAQSFHSARQSGTSSNSPPPSVSSVNSKQNLLAYMGSEILLNDGLSKVSSAVDNGLPDDQKEQIRVSQVRRKKDFIYNERVDRKMTNVIQGLELHTGVFNSDEQKTIVESVYNFQRMGQKGQLRERTYSEPRKWMRGKGRVTIQFGCCYNYAVDKDGNPPGIIRDEEVDPLPSVFKQMIKRMVRWQVLPPTCVPNSCIVNIYDEGDCIPPHIDHHDFVRPFCTVSFLAQCNIVFGSRLKTLGPGDFSGPVSIPLPVGSVLILNGNGADVAKHCVPSVPARRISITFRKMDDSKLPYKFLPDPELVGIKPIMHSQHHRDKKHTQNGSTSIHGTRNNLFVLEKDEFPPLGSGT